MADDGNINKFLEGQKCLIAEPSATFASSIQSTLYKMGVPSGDVITTKRFIDAQKAIETHKPRLLITEYNVEDKLGLTLVELLEKAQNGVPCISIIATSNSSDSAVAEAAEEQVDAFLLKPFSTEDFRLKLNIAIGKKLNPSPYSQKIKRGKELAAAAELDQALQEFIEAKPLEEKPTLACFYAGHTFEKLGDQAKALEQFMEGRKYQPLHYKCLVGQFDIFMSQKKYKEAYELVTLLKNNYPLTSKRLGQICVAAVFTLHFDDLEHFYELYLNLEHRTPELIKIISMAMWAAGKHFLLNGQRNQAAALFDKGLIITGREISFLGRVISELLNVKAYAEAQSFLSKALASDIGSPQHNLLSFRIDMVSLERHKMIERGRKLVMDGQATPEIVQTLVTAMAEDGKEVMAESLILRALKDYPDMRAALYKIIEKKID